MKKHVVANVAIGALLVPIGVWFGLAPAVVKWKVHARYPDVKVTAVDLGWKTVTLQGITFDRKWVHGTVVSAIVSWSGDSVAIHGGQIDADLDAKPPKTSDESSGRRITFDNLAAHVRKGSAEVSLVGAASDGGKVCWASGGAKHPRGEATFGHGCAEKDGSHVTVDDATVQALDIPHVPIGTTLRVTTAAYDGQKATLAKVTGEMELAEKTVASAEVRGLTITLPSAGAIMDVGVESITVTHPMIWTDPVTFTDVHATPGQGTWWHMAIHGTNFDVNPAGLAAHNSAFGSTCQAWVDALPDELRIEPLKSLEFSGTFVWDVDLKAKPPKINFSTCRVLPKACVPIKYLRGPFTYWAYSPEGDLFPRSTGVGDHDWVALEETGPMATAVVNFEDYWFKDHGGFTSAAYGQALIADLKAGQFLRGGSTITMQLAKNLWLRRSKTLGRKVQEMFLSTALDSCLTKDEIMETYLNVVEFGPLIYGVKQGASYWFKKTPAELTPVEAFWLASILTNPHKAGRKPTPEALERTSKVMQRFASMGRDVGDIGPLDDPTE